ncbi:MAG: PH domain-containing protein [candidate division WOR-3 bacterium]
MSYIDDNLMSGEHIIYRAKLHWVVFGIPIIFAVIIAVITLVLFFAGGDTIAMGYVFLFFLLIAIIWVVSSFISFKTSEFGVTSKRVLVKVGWIRRNSLEILLAKIEGIQANQGILGRILNYGTIVIKGTGGTSNPFHKIEAPFEFRKKVQEQIDLIQR